MSLGRAYGELQAIVRDFTVAVAREGQSTGRRFAPLTNIASDARRRQDPPDGASDR